VSRAVEADRLLHELRAAVAAVEQAADGVWSHDEHAAAVRLACVVKQIDQWMASGERIPSEWREGRYLVMVAEIAKRTGRSRQRAHVLTRHPEFPAPAAELAAGKVWCWHEVQEFLSRDRPPGRRPRSQGTGEG
jgi:hypothetical protein